jgi:DNA-binding response OmpR family regulator
MNDFSVDWVDDGKHALQIFHSGNYHLCVLDIMLPNVDGITIAKNIKELDASVPFIFLTAKTLKEDILKGYQSGADDYLTKPFDSEVLIYKIKAILQRKNLSGISIPNDQETFQLGKYTFDYRVRSLIIDDKPIKLSPKEAELLKLLCHHKNDILYRDVALKSIWGEEGYFTTRSMDVYITKLRKYLKNDPAIEILNVHGNGFRLLIS